MNMSRILKYNQHKESIIMAEELIEMIVNPKLNESIDDNHIQKILRELANDLKFNWSLVFTFGVGIRAMYPVVENLIKNGNLKVELNSENIILLTITALAITYLEEKNNKSGDDVIKCQECSGPDKDCKSCRGTGMIRSEIKKSDVRTMLEELKLRGFGNGIVKKVASSFKSIGNLFKILFKNTPYVIGGFLDMITYTSILIPTMNAISWMVDKYQFNMETFAANFSSIGVGISTLLAKKGFNYLVNRLGDKVNINGDLEAQTLDMPHDIKDGEEGDLGRNKLIKEQ